MVEEEPELDFDGPWKEAIEWAFEDFLRFFFIPVHSAIDWSRGYEFLDKELSQLVRESETGRGTVDKLAKVWLVDGTERWVLVHVEVQNQAQSTFAERMYTYNHRLRDRYGRMPISVAILGDERPTWHPQEFVEECGGCEVRFRFPTAKLLEWKESDLARSDNPFAVVVFAHLQTLATRGEPGDRMSIKWTLVRGLFECGLDRRRVRQLLRLIDWIMALPPPRQFEFLKTIERYEEERKMSFVSVFEEIAIKRGHEMGKAEGKAEGLHSAIESILDVRFGPAGLVLMPKVRAIADPVALSELQRFAVTADLATIAARLPGEAP